MDDELGGHINNACILNLFCYNTCKEVSILPTPLVSESAGDPRSALGVTGGGGAAAGAIKWRCAALQLSCHPAMNKLVSADTVSDAPSPLTTATQLQSFRHQSR